MEGAKLILMRFPSSSAIVYRRSRLFFIFHSSAKRTPHQVDRNCGTASDQAKFSTPESDEVKPCHDQRETSQITKNQKM